MRSHTETEQYSASTTTPTKAIGKQSAKSQIKADVSESESLIDSE